MKFGYHHASFQYDEDAPIFESVRERAQFLEDAGFEWFSLMDHLWQIPGNGRTDEEFFDCYTVLPAIAAVTDEIELGALVTCVHYRNPAVLGRIVTTLDHVSGGRAVLGVGAGWYEDEYDAYGFEFPPAAERIHQLDDAIGLIEAMWTEESPVTYRGDHYEIEELILEPKPVASPRPPILVGGGGERLTLRVVAERADRWNIPGASPERYERKLDVLADHCETAGRDYDEIEKTVANTVVVRETTDAAHDAYEALMSGTESGPAPREEFRGLVGTAEEVAAGVEAFAELGVDTFVMKAPKNDRETVERFADDVAPTVG